MKDWIMGTDTDRKNCKPSISWETVPWVLKQRFWIQPFYKSVARCRQKLYITNQLPATL